MDIRTEKFQKKLDHIEFHFVAFKMLENDILVAHCWW